MSDERLRELERRWKGNGLAADEAAWLLARVRAGNLAADRLELALRLGHEAALLAICPGTTGTWIFPRPAEAIAKIRPWGREVVSLALIASAEFYLGNSEMRYRRFYRDTERCLHTGSLQSNETISRLLCEALALARRNLLQPQDSDRQRLRQMQRLLLREGEATHFINERQVRMVNRIVAITLFTGDSALARAVREGRTLLNYSAPEYDSDVGCSLAMRDELIPWVLGYRDPVRERCVRRSSETE